VYVEFKTHFCRKLLLLLAVFGNWLSGDCFCMPDAFPVDKTHNMMINFVSFVQLCHIETEVSVDYVMRILIGSVEYVD